MGLEFVHCALVFCIVLHPQGVDLPIFFVDTLPIFNYDLVSLTQEAGLQILSDVLFRSIDLSELPRDLLVCSFGRLSRSRLRS